MGTENLETLLERLIEVNEAILSEISEIKTGIEEIKDELNWVGEHSYAKMVYDGLNEIESKLSEIETNTDPLLNA